MLNKKLVSIVIPAYNCEKTIKKCIDSIICQDYNNVEIIIINDGSTDGTELCLNEYLNNPKINVINKNNEGVSATRNLGIDISNGEYIIFIDSDDYIEQNYVSSLIELQEKNNESLCGCFIVRCSENGDFKIIKHDMKYEKSIFINQIIKANIDGFIVRYLFKKEILKNVKFDLNLSYMEDTLFLLNYLSNSKVKNIVFTNKTNYIYMYQSNNSVTNSEKYIENNIINVCNSIDQIYIYSLKKYDKKYEKTLMQRKAKMIEYCFSKIKTKSVYKSVKTNYEIKQIYNSCIKSKIINLKWKLLIIFLFNSPYFMFRLYIFMRNILRKIKR